MTCRIPNLFFWAVILGIAFFVLAASVIGSSQDLDEGNAYLAYHAVVDASQDNMQSGVNNLFSPVVTTTRLIEQTNLQLQYCSLPLDSTDYYANFYYLPLIQLMNAYVGQNNTIMQSIGIISVDEAGTSQANFCNKISCEMALDTFNLGCPDYVYACTDNSTNFLGFCASSNGTVDLASTIYSSQDNGLTPQEVELFTNPNQKAIFLPIFNLLGQFSLTYERSYWCPGGTSAYAATFAQKNLNQLNEYLSTLTIGITGVGYLIEKDTGLLIATSVEGEPLVDDNNNRISCINATNPVIRNSARFLVDRAPFPDYNGHFYFDPRYDNTDGLIITVHHVHSDDFDAELEWLSIVAVPESDYAGWIQGRAKWSILVGSLVAFALWVVLLVAVYYFQNRPLKYVNVWAWITEIQMQRDRLVSK